VISRYLNHEAGLTAHKRFDDYWINENVKLLEVRMRDEEGQTAANFSWNQDIGVDITYEVKTRGAFTHSLNVFDQGGSYIFSTHDIKTGEGKFEKEPGIYKATAWIPKKLLKEGPYRIGFAFIRYNPFEVVGTHKLDIVGFNTFIDINDTSSIRAYYSGHVAGAVMPDVNWELQQVGELV
jgi:hypothetical protein